jgi:hypothetical protein
VGENNLLAEFTTFLAIFSFYWRKRPVYWRKSDYIGEVHKFFGELEIPADFYQLPKNKKTGHPRPVYK